MFPNLLNNSLTISFIDLIKTQFAEIIKTIFNAELASFKYEKSYFTEVPVLVIFSHIHRKQQEASLKGDGRKRGCDRRDLNCVASITNFSLISSIKSSTSSCALTVDPVDIDRGNCCGNVEIKSRYSGR
jgi:hypothetical protein